MPTNIQSTKAKAIAKPRLVPSNRSVFLSSGVATESTTPAQPDPSLTNDTAAMNAQLFNRHVQSAKLYCHVTPFIPASLPDTTVASQATTSQLNASVPSVQSQVGSVEPATFPNSSTGQNGSAVDRRPSNSAAHNVQCSCCGWKGHSEDMCRRRKRVVGCLICGAKGHLDHQCKTSGSQCRYCFGIGHPEATCPLWKNDNTQCLYCTKFGHPEYRCYKKARDLASHEHRASTDHPTSDSLDVAPLQNRNAGLSKKSNLPHGQSAPGVNTSMRSTASDTKNASHGHRAPATQAGNTAITIQEKPVQKVVEADPGRFQVQQSTSRTLPVSYTLAPNDGTQLSEIKDKQTNGNPSQKPANQDKAGSIAHESASKSEESETDPRAGLGASAKTRPRKTSANKDPIVYVFWDAMHNNRVQKPVTTDTPDLIEFQRKLMRERREEAIRLRRA